MKSSLPAYSVGILLFRDLLTDIEISFSLSDSVRTLFDGSVLGEGAGSPDRKTGRKTPKTSAVSNARRAQAPGAKIPNTNARLLPGKR